MIKEVTAVGKTILEAQENARAALGAGELEDVQFEILDAGSKGIFGIIGVRPAKVRAFIESPDAPERHRRHEKPAKEERRSEEGAPRQDGKKKKNRPDRKKSSRPAVAAKPSAPKSEVIPEAELKMELRSVGEGEDMSFDFVKTVISDIGLSATAELYACEDSTRRIVISGEDASVLIGHHGETLDALQYLANLASARKNANGERDKSRVTLDIEGYRKKREETLRALARRKAATALRTGRSVMLEPMSAYERRIIHSEIQNIEGVSTNSIGSDNNRKIVIFLTDKRPGGLFEEVPKTPLAEEFAPDENADNVDAAIGAEISHSFEDESEDVAVEALRPVDDLVDSDEDIK